MEDLVLNILHSSGYTSSNQNCLLQTFDMNSVQYLATHTSLPLVFLAETPFSFDALTEISPLLHGIGLAKQMIFPENDQYEQLPDMELLSLIQSLDLKIHVFTMRDEAQFILENSHGNPHREYEQFLKLGVDGFFTDFPHTLRRYLDNLYKNVSTKSTDEL